MIGLREIVCCFAWFVSLVSHDGCVALPHTAMDLSEVCDCTHLLFLILKPKYTVSEVTYHK